jgi:hypothetical protein
MLGLIEPEAMKRAFRFQAAHPEWRIKSINGGSTYVATQNLDHSAHVIAMDSLTSLMDRLEEEQGQSRGKARK